MKALAAVVFGSILVLTGHSADSGAVPLELLRGDDLSRIHTRAAVRSPTPLAASVRSHGLRRAATGPTPVHGGRTSDLADPPFTTENAPPEVAPEALTAVVRRLCGTCHNDQLMTGNLSLEHFDVARAPEMAATAEKMIVKLRAGMMPPPGIPRPGGDTLVALVETLERLIDAAAAKSPNPGSRTFQRLNRAEYERSIQDLLALEIDAGDWLPLDTKSANFDNIADVQMLSPTLLDAYLTAASDISRLAIGDPDAEPTAVPYDVPRLASQTDHVDGAPIGTRGGISVAHTFPADGEYVFKVSFQYTPQGYLYGTNARGQRMEISIDGERVALLEIDRLMSESDPSGVNLETDPIPVRAGQHRVSAAFIPTFRGPVEDLVTPHGHSIPDLHIGLAYGITTVPHLRDLVISGPYNPTGTSMTASRRKIFTCRPTVPAEERPCAEQIVSELASEAFRRPVTAADLEILMPFYEQGAAEDGFEDGIRTALTAILASPDFVFRFEEPTGPVEPGGSYRIGDFDLATRLSFFLWGTPPDDELMALARVEDLSDPAVLEAQARRMLEDPRSRALATRFAAQWLRLQDLEKLYPDAVLYPDFHEQLAQDMRRETELFFYYLVRENRSLLELFTADYTFLNQRLAEHYGIDGVAGDEFRRVEYPTERRRGILGHGSVLALTSHANRTSPVLRGKWVMEVLLGTPPPPPPPGVPDLEQTAGAVDGRLLTTRERMEIHRANPVCNSCHQFMDPIGLALDNFGVTGRWRIRENGMPLDTRGDFYDGTPISDLQDLTRVLLERPVPLVRNFTANLMTYALGRRVEYYDQPTIRAIAKAAKANGYRMSSFILGVVTSDTFRMKRAGSTSVIADAAAESDRQ